MSHATSPRPHRANMHKARPQRFPALATLAWALAIALPALPLSAQQPTAEQLKQQAEQALGRPITDQEILRRIRESGLTADQIRQRLQALGYDAHLADAYLNALQGNGPVPPGGVPLPLVQVLTQAEASAAGATGFRPQLGAVPAPPVAQNPAISAGTSQSPPVFGRSLFSRATSQFQPVTTGPVPPDYRVGPGDELVLVLTGGVERAYQLMVSREGWVVIPDVGRVYINGKTLDGVRQTLFQRLSQVYSGIKGGPEATTHFDVTLGDLRTNQVYVIGEVERPAAYTVSSLATAMTALYYAGGPTRNGSFRNVIVNRGGTTVATIDLYRYLVGGSSSQDVRLEQGDIVYVPVAGTKVEVDGAVTRPAIYDLKPGEGLADLVRYAGGIQADAELRRVQIERILPAAQRTPGHERELLDIPVERLLAADSTSPAAPAQPADAGASSADAAARGDVALRDGDRVTVFAVLREARNQVTLSGGVWHPGTYAASDSTRLWDLIGLAGGLLPDAYQGRAQIQRLEPDHTRRLIPVSLRRGPDGSPVENPRLQGMDQVIVFSERSLREDQAVSVGGWVRYPGVYPYVNGMTVADLLLEAGGLRTGAYLSDAEVARVVVSQSATDTLTRRFLVPLDSSYVFDLAPADDGQSGAARSKTPGGAGASGDPAARFRLENLDAVYVRKAPGYEPQERVVITGQVEFPGPYSIRSRGERLTDLVARAGGLTSQAYAEGFQLWRAERVTGTEELSAAGIAGQAVGGAAGAPGLAVDTTTSAAPAAAVTDSLAASRRELLAQRAARALAQSRAAARTRVGIDFARALRNPSGPENILVEPDDSIFVPRYVPTVTVRGAVGVETKVLWRNGKGLGYYIDQAGGYASDADRSRVRIRFANGEVASRGPKFLIFGGGIPDPDPGSTITVPVAPPRPPGISVGTMFGILTSVATAAATVVIAVKR
jgi:polysaccharide biosynthesis/export protein